MENLQLEDTVDVNKFYNFAKTDLSLSQDNLLLEVEENNYASLREHNRRHLTQSMK